MKRLKTSSGGCTKRPYIIKHKNLHRIDFGRTPLVARVAVFQLGHPALVPGVGKVHKEDQLDNHEEERADEANPAPGCRSF